MEEKSFIKYGRLTALAEPKDIEKYKDGQFTVFEKIDGGNCQVRKTDNWQLVGGSKANYLKGKYVHKRKWFEEFNGWIHGNASLFNLSQEVILFGEWSGNHTIEYLQDYQDKFFVIDLFDLKRGAFYPYRHTRELLTSWGIQDVLFLDVLAQGSLGRDNIESLLNEPSKYYHGPREGVVVKDYETKEQQFFKIYHPDFSEKVPLKGKIFYLTPARFRKNIYRLIEERGFERVTLPQLLNGVREDVQSEEGVKLKDEEIMRYLNQYLRESKFMRAERFLDYNSSLK